MNETGMEVGEVASTERGTGEHFGTKRDRFSMSRSADSSNYLKTYQYLSDYLDMQ